MACQVYKEFSLNKCPDAFVIVGAFDALVTVNWTFTSTWFQVNYRGAADTDELGVLTIPVDGTALKQEFFSPYLGTFEVRASTVDTDGNEVPVLFSGLYDFLVLKFVEVDTLPAPNNVTITLEEEIID